MIRRKARRMRLVPIDCDVIEDARLSWAARGLLIYLLSKPDDWEISFAQLLQASPQDKKTALRSTFRELTTIGYACLEQQRDETSHRAQGRRYIVSEEPISDSQETRLSEKPNVRDSESQEICLSEKYKENNGLVRETGFLNVRDSESQKTCLISLKNKTQEETTEKENPSVSTIVETSPHDEKPTLSKKSPRLLTDYSAGFQHWWEAYPADRRVGKPKCFAVWVKERLEPRTDELVAKLERLKLTTWNRVDAEDRHYIKTSLPYLHDGRYEDDLVPLPSVPTQQESGLSAKAYRSALVSRTLIEEIQHGGDRQPALLPGAESHDRTVSG